MKEILSIHIGQAGIQIGEACWELYCLEHGISPDGMLTEKLKDSPSSSFLFSERSTGRRIPRALMVDLEPSVVDCIKLSEYKNLHHPDNLVSGMEDAANNYGRGYYGVGREIIDQTVNRIRRIVDDCDNLQGLMIFRSFGGGTGSGFGSLLLDKLVSEYPKISKLEFAIYPASKITTAVVEPYNSVLTAHTSSETSSCTFLLDNEAIYNITQNLKVVSPEYSDINRVIAQVQSSITSPLRFPGDHNIDIEEYITNLVPHPRIHYPLISYYPMVPKSSASHQSLSVQEITDMCFEPNNQLVKCDAVNGKYMSCCMLFRGDVNPMEASDAINRLKMNKKRQFVQWCPTGFKLSLNGSKPVVVPGDPMASVSRALCVLANNTAISEAWKRLSTKFDLMFSKRAFVHWYIQEGMEEEEFYEAREDMSLLIEEYENIHAG